MESITRRIDDDESDVGFFLFDDGILRNEMFYFASYKIALMLEMIEFGIDMCIINRIGYDFDTDQLGTYALCQETESDRTSPQYKSRTVPW